MPSRLPTLQDATDIAERRLGQRVLRCERFPTGLRHWVYDVELRTGQRVVVRLSHPNNRAELAGALFWTERLHTVDVPVAKVLHHDVHAAQPYMVSERLLGTDLGNVFDELTEAQLMAIAASVAEMQRQTSLLPTAEGHGYALDYSQPQLLSASWLDIVRNEIDRAERRIRDIGVVDPALAFAVRAGVDDWSESLDAVKPVAFLHDATTKNVIIHNGHVSGLVDVDSMAFGDPLWAVALTRMSLLSAGRSLFYTDQLDMAMGRSDDNLLDLYTSVFCLGFLGELGQSFNKDQPALVDTKLQRHLEAILHDFITN